MSRRRARSSHLLFSFLFRCNNSSVTSIFCALSTRIPPSLKMPKKKKTQQKPIHRGFAVTSIPKKAPPERRDDSDGKVESASTELPHTAQTHEPLENETFSRQKAEEQSLQDLVDRLQERTEKEIVRTIKVRGCTREMSPRGSFDLTPRPSKRKSDFPTLCRC